MPKAFLTDAQLKAIKPPAAGISELWDQKCSGLALRVMSSGLRSWSFRYRPLESRSFKRMTLGHYPSVGLAEARDRAMALRLAVRDGGNPQHEKKATFASSRLLEERDELTFERLADQYIERYARPNKSSWMADRGFLRRHVVPEWKGVRAAEITRRDIVRLLSKILVTTPTGANRTRSVLAKLFSWAVDEDLLTANPLLGVKKPHKEGGGRTRILSDDELRWLWRTVDASSLAKGTAAALKVIALLGQRPGEVAGMERSELVHLDKPNEARWEIPAKRMKARQPHVVPLPPLAREIIEQQIRQTGDNDFVFASKYLSRTRLARHSLSQAMKRLIKGLEHASETSPIISQLVASPPTPHDLRRTVASRLSEQGVAREDRLAILAHRWGDIHEIHYDRYDRLREKRTALEGWERHVRQVLHLEAAAMPMLNVVQH